MRVPVTPLTCYVTVLNQLAAGAGMELVDDSRRRRGITWVYHLANFFHVLLVFVCQKKSVSAHKLDIAQGRDQA